MKSELSNLKIIYGSKRGNSKRVGAYILDRFPEASLADAKDFVSLSVATTDCAEQYLFIASTWGDGELQDDMEALLRNSMRRQFSADAHVIELGNYYGYDDFSFGALNIMEQELNRLNYRVVGRLSLDSMPKVDWATLDRWLESEIS